MTTEKAAPINVRYCSFGHRWVFFWQRTTGANSWFFSQNSIEGSREVEESHQAALWLDSLEAVAGGLPDSENSVLAETKLAEASLFSAKPSACLGQVIQPVVHHSLHGLVAGLYSDGQVARAELFVH